MSALVDTLPTRVSTTPGEHEIHLVPAAWTGNRIARCGFDCSDRDPRLFQGATCAICLDLSRVARRAQ